MQGMVCAPDGDFQTGSPPPNEESASHNDKKMESKSDSGIVSSMGNSVLGTTKSESEDVEDRPGSTGSNSSRSSNCGSPDTNRKYLCPICEAVFTAQHEFTLHIRSHNENSQDVLENQRSFICSICCKVLSSGASLDRHMLIHSGERPFSCKYCGDTFTTNGNMHRHMRTHSNRAENYESDGSSDSGTSVGSSKNVIEYNNNRVSSSNSKAKVGGKRKATNNREYLYKKSRNDFDTETQNYTCPVCERDDFNSFGSLETHIGDNHHDYPAKCNSCEKTFSNHKLLGEHRTLMHCIGEEGGRTVKNSVVGFTDLTFVDFSSRKFPHIARYECEKNLHKVAGGLKFQCEKCNRAFPCATSLEIHESSCTTTTINAGLDLSLSTSTILEPSIADNVKRSDFFAKLDLQNLDKRKTENVPAKVTQVAETKDLADIQSIISMTSDGTLLKQLNDKDSDLNVSQKGDNNQEEESQDLFAAEFRKMKLRGEFPCRLCTAIFPNLRALKGHNRTHLNSNNNGAYRCNMCPHSSLDKAALIRHMRSHNGDRPYECSLCNYAFTTKANCERHLRNRHSKNTREEVKKAIIYHPSEDPSNEEITKMLTTKEDYQKNLNLSENSITNKNYNDSTNFTMHQDIKETEETKDHETVSYSNLKFCPNTTDTSTPLKAPFKIQVRNLDNLMKFSSPESHVNAIENPDIALDLSKKKTAPSEQLEFRPKPKISCANDLLTQQLMKGAAKIDPATFYASQLAFYRNSFPALPAIPTFPFALNPLLFQSLPAPIMPPDSQIIKDRLQRLQLCGGNMVVDTFAERLKSLQQQSQQKLIENNKPIEAVTIKSEKIELSPLKIEPASSIHSSESNLSNNLLKMHSPIKSENISSPSSVKMVIKNGVLMPKQKQRRYRTERPFSCEYCSARFTLRSNMERHIKQQHPQFWSQRQRSGCGGSGRKASSNANNNRNYCNLTIPNYEVPQNKSEAKDDSKVSEHLKYAILAQQLKAVQNYSLHNDDRRDKLEVKTEDENEGDLVIDENTKMDQQFAAGILEKNEDIQDLVPVSRLLDNASQQPFKEYFQRQGDIREMAGFSEEDEEGLVASSTTSDENNSGTDENRSESENSANSPPKKKSAYSLAPNRVSCPYCQRKFPWTSSLRRHVLTHTGQKPFKCSHCPLLFTTKSNCDRHLLRKHGSLSATINSSDSQTNNNYMTRNVPERPFKCSTCPSSTFSTYVNLKKHMHCKHAANSDDGYSQISTGYEAGSSEDEKGSHLIYQINKSSMDSGSESAHQNSSASCVQQNCDLPFKCHLCDASFADRQETVDHMKEKHEQEYELLMSKNAFDINATVPDETNSHLHHDENDEGNEMKGGKFPDYANRKVICAFCMRRFWSAEDLRRHMRTHTGERPFSCDICQRRFTLKHSMLRHRKKHNVPFENSDNLNSDEELHHSSHQPIFTTLSKFVKGKSDEEVPEGNDLISNLLGIRDRSIIDQVLTASADDAAKLLGVKNS